MAKPIVEKLPHSRAKAQVVAPETTKRSNPANVLPTSRPTKRQKVDAESEHESEFDGLKSDSELVSESGSETSGTQILSDSAGQEPKSASTGNVDDVDNGDKSVDQLQHDIQDNIDSNHDGNVNMEEPEEQETTFAALGVNDALCDSCKALNYKFAMPIQVAAIPPALAGRDVIGVAETGSGKTAAFAIPILQSLLEKPRPFFGLVIAPTRELAIQIAKVFEALGSIINATCSVIVGGVSLTDQMVSLGKKPHIIVATPGRLLEHLEKSKGFSLHRLEYLVLDEADKLLDLDFGPAIDKILSKLPRERKTFLFSATMSTKVEKLQRASLRDPIRVSVNNRNHQTAKKLKQKLWVIPQVHKDHCLVYLMNNFDGKSIIVFARTWLDTLRLAILLRELGFQAVPLFGKLTMANRLSTLNKFRAKSRNILVATDVASRGLDIPAVDLVVNYDLPQDSKTYVHRVGRTARAGRSGMAINMCTQYDVEVFLRIEHFLGTKMEVYEEYDEELIRPIMVRVEEAQRAARREVKDVKDKKTRKPGRDGRGGGGTVGVKRLKNFGNDEEDG